MTILMLSKERRARVWLDKLPENEVFLASATDHHRRIDVAGNCASKRKIVAVELFIPLGGRFLYGLLGCEAIGEKSSTLDVVVQTSLKKEKQFTDSLAGKLDLVWWGLPDEYANAILNGATAGISKFGSPTAQSIRFCCAAHGEIGSTVSIFERLGMVTTALLTLPAESHADIVTTLEQILDTAPSASSREHLPVQGCAPGRRHPD